MYTQHAVVYRNDQKVTDYGKRYITNEQFGSMMLQLNILQLHGEHLEITTNASRATDYRRTEIYVTRHHKDDTIQTTFTKCMESVEQEERMEDAVEALNAYHKAQRGEINGIEETYAEYCKAFQMLTDSQKEELRNLE